MNALKLSHIQDVLSKNSGSNLSEKINANVLPIVYGASLGALRKKHSGIRSFAVGTFFRRLIAKLSCSKIKEFFGDLFHPIQFGFGTSGGWEVVAHVARRYLNERSNPSSSVLPKLEFQNAFNMKPTQCYQKPTFLNLNRMLFQLLAS